MPHPLLDILHPLLKRSLGANLKKTHFAETKILTMRWGLQRRAGRHSALEAAERCAGQDWRSMSLSFWGFWSSVSKYGICVWVCVCVCVYQCCSRFGFRVGFNFGWECVFWVWVESRWVCCEVWVWVQIWELSVCLKFWFKLPVLVLVSSLSLLWVPISGFSVCFWVWYFWVSEPEFENIEFGSVCFYNCEFELPAGSNLVWADYGFIFRVWVSVLEFELIVCLNFRFEFEWGFVEFECSGLISSVRVWVWVDCVFKLPVLEVWAWLLSFCAGYNLWFPLFFWVWVEVSWWCVSRLGLSVGVWVQLFGSSLSSEWVQTSGWNEFEFIVCCVSQSVFESECEQPWHSHNMRVFAVCEDRESEANLWRARYPGWKMWCPRTRKWNVSK